MTTSAENDGISLTPTERVIDSLRLIPDVDIPECCANEAVEAIARAIQEATDGAYEQCAKIAMHHLNRASGSTEKWRVEQVLNAIRALKSQPHTKTE